VAISVGGAQGLVGYVASGDRVDVYYETAGAGGTVLGLLASNVLVMRAPGAGAPAILRLNSAQAQTMALASNSGTLWFLLRPAGNAKEPPRKAITTQQIQQLITSQTKR
jgi:Flp pilus assembly protein CpaB